MSKGIIVVDMPERCNQCKFWFAKATAPIEYRCMGEQKNITEKHLNENKPDWCPIKPLPEKAHHEEYCDNGRYGKGWNECIDEMLKEAE